MRTLVLACGCWFLLALPAFSQTPPPILCLLLDDFSTVEGSVESFNGVLRVTTSNGSAKLLRSHQVLHSAGSLNDVYDFMLKRAKTDAASTLQLALWCEKVGLKSQALTHAQAAEALGSPAAKELQQRLAQAKPAKVDPAVKPASAAVAIKPVSSLNAEASLPFASKIQPVLMNLCVNCHTPKHHAGPFRLDRVSVGLSNGEVTASNLQVVAEQVNREQPLKSPLLVYAYTAHGGQKLPAFTNRDHPAYRNLEAWVLMAVPAQVVQVGFEKRLPIAEPPVESAPAVVLPKFVTPPAAAPPAPMAVVPPPPTPPVVTPPSPGRANDPFDPQQFNSQPRSPATSR